MMILTLSGINTYTDKYYYINDDNDNVDNDDLK